MSNQDSPSDNISGNVIDNTATTDKQAVSSDNTIQTPTLTPQSSLHGMPSQANTGSSLDNDENTPIFNSNCTVYYKDVNVKVSVPMENEVKHAASPCVSLVKAIQTKGASCKQKDFYRIKDVSGIIRPNTMTLVLSGPGQGKSTYLRALANRIPLSSGQVVYNGRNFEQAQKEGCDLKKMTQYVDQVDTHLPLLTVYETLDFAHRLTSVNYDPQRVEDIITLLGMEECRNTIIGNALIRGISGGQRKRVTVGELLVSDASTLFLDEYSNGLDSSTAEDIGKGLRKFCQRYNSSIVATLQQPTPELLALFDRIVVLREGQVVFDGPVCDVEPYFAAMGFICPNDVDACDFFIDCLSQPRSVLVRQQTEELYKYKKTGKKSPKPSAITTSYGKINVSPQPCITTEEMVQFYQTTPQWNEIKQELDDVVPDANSTPTDELTPEQKSKFEPLMPTDEAKQMYKLGYRLSTMQMLKEVCDRTFFKTTLRNKQSLIPRLIVCIFMSFLFSSFYFQIEPDEYMYRLSVTVIACGQIAFASMVELSLSYFSVLVVKKQLSANFYPSWIFSLSSFLSSLPMSFVESFVYSIVLYFMTGNYASAGRFFLHFATLLTVSIMISAWMRLLAAIAPDEQSAQAFAGSSTGVMLVFAGLFTGRSQIPKWMIWIYWLSPFSWACRALLNIEFLAPRYDEIVVTTSGTNIRLGDLYLKTMDMYVGLNWVGWSALFVVGFTLFIVVLTSIVLRTHFYEESIGTRRSNDGDDDLVEADIDNKDTVNTLSDDDIRAQVQAAALQQVEIQREQSRGGGESQIRSLMTNNQTMNGASTNNTTVLKTLREHLPFTPVWLSFSDVKYTVKVKKDKQTVDRILLNSVSGYAQPGKVTGLLGQSGAGKSTLLDVIAGLKNTGVVEGKILINGQPATKQLIATMTGYIEQFDTLFPYQTVYETLLFAAKMRLPRSISDEIKIKIVDEIIDVLDLASMKHFIIGNAKIQGLSPAQAKRVNIGVELVANPSILFLDEPTTGLDSKSAQIVMKVVKRIARSGRAIICTIHQPSAELFFLFDRLLLLGAGGHQIYFGDVGHRAQKLVQYLSRCPGVKPIQPRVNPATWMLIELGVGVASVKKDNGGAKDDQDGQIQGNDNNNNGNNRNDQFVVEDDPEWTDLPPAQKTVLKFKKIYFQSEEYKMAKRRIDVLESIEIIDVNDEDGVERHKKEVELMQMKRQNATTTNNNTNNNNNITDSVNTSRTTLPTTTIIIPSQARATIWTQFTNLFVRNSSAYWRNPGFIYSRHGIQLFLSLLFGCVFFNSQATTVSSANALIGSIFMTLIFAAVGLLSTGIPLYFEARAVFYREKASGYYFPTLWAICQLFIEIMWIPISLIMAVPVAYFMIGLEADAGIFFTYCFSSAVLFLAYITVGILLSSVLPSSAQAITIGSAFLSVQKAVSGVSLVKPFIPKYWLWLHNVLPGSHCFMALILPQFRNNDTEMVTVVGTVEKIVTVKDYVSTYLGYSVTLQPFIANLWAILFIGVVLTISFIATTFISFNKR